MAVGSPVCDLLPFRRPRCWGSLNLSGLLVRAVVCH